MKTFSIKPSQIKRQWWVVDAENKVLGRLATQVANILRGKHKAEFTPNMDTGDFVIIINAEKIKVTGSKAEDKQYYWHSGYPGGIKQRRFSDLIKVKPEWVIERSIKGMLPKNPLGRSVFRKLKVYRGVNHPHQAQQPLPFELSG